MEFTWTPNFSPPSGMAAMLPSIDNTTRGWSTLIKPLSSTTWPCSSARRAVFWAPLVVNSSVRSGFGGLNSVMGDDVTFGLARAGAWGAPVVALAGVAALDAGVWAAALAVGAGSCVE